MNFIPNKDHCYKVSGCLIILFFCTLDQTCLTKGAGSSTPLSVQNNACCSTMTCAIVQTNSVCLGRPNTAITLSMRR